MLNKLMKPDFFIPVLLVALVAIALRNRVEFIRNITG